MFKIDTPTAAAALPAPVAAGTPGYFAHSDVAGGIGPTELTSDYMNMLMMELINVVTAGGLTPSKTTYDQVKTAINTMIGTAIVASNVALLTNLAPQLAFVGEVKSYYGLVAPAGWLLANGQTIGSAASGATARANADTATLYALLWGGTANADLVIQTSAGANTTRGASAAADFAANKRLPLPNHPGVVERGIDAGRGFGGPTGLAEYQEDAFQGHVMDLPDMPQNGPGFGYSGGSGVTGTPVTQTGGPLDDGTHGAPRIAAETRVKSIGVNKIIKY